MSTSDPHAQQPVLSAGPALAEAEAVVLAIHGRGASPSDILGLRPAFDRESVAWLAPAAAGRAWYPFRFIAEVEKNQPYLDSALRRIRALVDEVVAAGVPPERIVLLGFSQGACLSSEFVARQPRRWGGLVAFSGGLIGAPGTEWTTPGSLDDTPIFIGCSDVDDHIPLERVEETGQVLTRMGGALELRIYPGMGHTVNADEIAFGRRVVDSARRWGR
jgi:predicted esterase